MKKRKLPAPVLREDEYLTAIAEDTSAIRALLEKVLKLLEKG